MDDAVEYICSNCNSTFTDSDGICCQCNSTENFEELLINEVYSRPLLWNQALPVKDRGPRAKNEAWNEIDRILNVESGTSQKKWKNLRDVFVRKLNEQKKYIPSGSGSEAKPKPEKWQYYEMLSFLRPTVAYKRTFTNASLPATKLLRTSENTNHGDLGNNTSMNHAHGHASQQECNVEESELSPSCSNDSICSIDSAVILQRSRSSLLKESKTGNSASHVKAPLELSPSCSNDSWSNNSPGQQRKRSRSSSRESKLDEIEIALLNNITKPIEKSDEIATFCRFLENRMRLLTPKYYRKLSHKVMSYLMEIETQESRE